MDIIMISGACCIPVMASIDKKARKILDEALSTTGIQAKISTIKATDAYGNADIRKLMNKGIQMTDAPVILIDGEIISCGVPKIDDLKNALIKSSKKPKES